MPPGFTMLQRLGGMLSLELRSFTGTECVYGHWFTMYQGVVVVLTLTRIIMYQVVVVLTLTRIIKSLVAVQAPVTLELRNTP